jgi:hypothetical protein
MELPVVVGVSTNTTERKLTVFRETPPSPLGPAPVGGEREREERRVGKGKTLSAVFVLQSALDYPIPQTMELPVVVGVSTNTTERKLTVFRETPPSPLGPAPVGGEREREERRVGKGKTLSAVFVLQSALDYPIPQTMELPVVVGVSYSSLFGSSPGICPPSPPS